MRKSDNIMGMPINVEIVSGSEKSINAVFEYFKKVDERFSTYKSNSEITKINRGDINSNQFSEEMKEVFNLAEKTKNETNDYFSITKPDGKIDPSGIVKGWAIKNAALLVEKMGYQNYFIEAGGDIASNGTDSSHNNWTVGIRNPFGQSEIIKIIEPKGCGVATSGTYARGQHIYNPHEPWQKIEDIVSLTVIGPDIYEADRFATAAFAMGKKGIYFIEQLNNFEGYLIDSSGTATMTTGLNKYIRC